MEGISTNEDAADANLIAFSRDTTWVRTYCARAALVNAATSRSSSGAVGGRRCYVNDPVDDSAQATKVPIVIVVRQHRVRVVGRILHETVIKRNFSALNPLRIIVIVVSSIVVFDSHGAPLDRPYERNATEISHATAWVRPTHVDIHDAAIGEVEIN